MKQNFSILITSILFFVRSIYLCNSFNINSKLSLPVYSLCTIDDFGRTNANILTYATTVSKEPSIWALSLYKSTLSHENFMKRKWCALQLLTKDHCNTINILGKRSGRDIDKYQELSKLGYETIDIMTPSQISIDSKLSILKDCPHILWFQKSMDIDVIDAGDHDVFICNLIDQVQLIEDYEYLTTDYLRRSKYI